MPKHRRHHNNKGRRQIQRGKTKRWVKQLAKRFGIPYKTRSQAVGGSLATHSRKEGKCE